MQTFHGDAPPKLKENELTESSSLSHLDDTIQQPGYYSPLEGEEEDDVQFLEDEYDQFNGNTSNQLVVYNPEVTDTDQSELANDADLDGYQLQPLSIYTKPNPPSRILPSVGAFTVQCANCFKWRLIPTKEKYEEIRETILQNPFVCETACAWRPGITCDDPTDISQDGSRLWAIDKPNIAQPPPGWERLLRIRGEGSTRFADIYYVAPSGKRLRSMVEIQRYLLEHPEYTDAGVTMSQFSFQIPKPLQENYVRKRPPGPPRVAPSYDGSGLGISSPLEPTDVNPLSWADPADSPELQLGGPGLSTPYVEVPIFDPEARPTKKRTTKSLSKDIYGNSPLYDCQFKTEEPERLKSGTTDLSL
ncbi:PREDICTED: methyl-CpG-binding domain-containing protein 2-like [Nelumbo nucifera]|uniref:Methyl-CpG-binding domain-containing protein 2-like n=2 Tax=Nelumbo nucifera TaxID=4432 RepID=A0A1U8A7Q0_NELNU|nr:PREDICTED: methyl-CpG-binding domain-containing protein 2-like [Nelumbo nucifera]DAD46201.1 TPA_asm: hypothetical protein HUJ06_004431 [Nelumbo nucifera]